MQKYPVHPTPSQKVYIVDKNVTKATQYLTFCGCCILPCITGCLSLICLPCIPCFAYKTASSEQAIVDEKAVHIKNGWINKKEKTIPLDRIQDVAIQEGIIQRMFGIASVHIETAGSSAGNGADGELLAPKDPKGLKNIIMENRDRLVLSAGELKPHSDWKANQPTSISDMSIELSNLNQTVLRIEQQIERGLSSKR